MDVLAKLKAKIASWRAQWITKVGKLILIQAVFSAFPIFGSTLLLAPKSILAQISKLVRDFIWNGSKGSQNKLHLVSWEVLMKPIMRPISQIRDLGMANLVLSGKLIWQLFVDKKTSCQQDC